MAEISDLQKENQSIIDLKAVLTKLIESKDLRDNPVFCELLERFRDSVQSHLDHEDRSVYSELLNHDDKHINEVASHFLNNTRELKRVFTGFVKKWCGKNSNSTDHEKFMRETKEIFHLIDVRIDMENSKLFPIVEKL